MPQKSWSRAGTGWLRVERCVPRLAGADLSPQPLSGVGDPGAAAARGARSPIPGPKQSRVAVV